MSVTIQEDMMAAALAMPRKQGDAFLVALLRYGFLNEEPSGKPAWYPTFITCKDRISMSADASTKGRKMAEARWGKQNAQAQTKHDADASDKHYAQESSVHDAQEKIEQSAEVSRGEVSRDEESKGERASNDASVLSAQIAEIITCLNETAGTHYKPSTPKTRSLITARIREGFGLDDFKAVIAKKCAEWRGTDMEKYLRPETLFGTKFEGYLNQITHQQKGGGYIADYD